MATEYYVRRPPSSVTNRPMVKTGGKQPALDMPSITVVYKTRVKSLIFKSITLDYRKRILFAQNAKNIKDIDRNRYFYILFCGKSLTIMWGNEIISLR